MSTSRDAHETFPLDRVELQSGLTLRNATLAYTTYGELNADKSNAIVHPTWYSGRHWENEWLIGPGHGVGRRCYTQPKRRGRAVGLAVDQPR